MEYKLNFEHCTAAFGISVRFMDASNGEHFGSVYSNGQVLKLSTRAGRECLEYTSLEAAKKAILAEFIEYIDTGFIHPTT